MLATICHFKSDLTSIMASNDNAVARARMARDLTQTELARRAGISRQALGAIESGAYHPGVAIAIRLARELGSTVESLFGEVDDETASLVDASWLDDEPQSCSSRAIAGRARARARKSRCRAATGRASHARAGGRPDAACPAAQSRRRMHVSTAE